MQERAGRNGSKKRFHNFLVAKNVTVDGRKKAMLLHYAGEEVFELSESINITDEDDYLETKEKLQIYYFAPKRNVKYEKFVFRQATQQPSEPLDKFNARLVSLSKYCNFTKKEREIKSQIIQKCLNDKVRNKGLTESDISLDALLTYGRTLEATKVQYESMINSTNKSMLLNAIKIPSKNQSADNRPVQYKRRSFNYSHQMAPPRGNYKHSASTYSKPDQTCPGCGGRPHNRKNCRAWGKLCHNCKKLNHFASVCKSNGN